VCAHAKGEEGGGGLDKLGLKEGLESKGRDRDSRILLRVSLPSSDSTSKMTRPSKSRA
jgi:hypothetical protein